MFEALFSLLSFETIRENLQFFINRLILGTITAIFLLLNGVDIDYDPMTIMTKNIILILTILIIMFTMYIIYLIISKYPKLVPLQMKLIWFSYDSLPVIVSGYILFIPSLIYGIFISIMNLSSFEHTLGLAINLFLILIIINSLLSFQPRLHGFIPDAWKVMPD